MTSARDQEFIGVHMRRLHADRASIADACAYTMFRMAGDAPACRLWRRLLQCTMHRDLHELAQVHAPHAS